MKTPESETLDLRIETQIDAFEESLAENGSAKISDFFPDRNDPLFLRVATELVRVDLELAWEAGVQKSLDDYSDVLPELQSDEQLRSEIAFEEYRQRCHHGQNISLDEFSSKYNVTTEGWSTVVKAKDETQTTTDFDELSKRVPTNGQRWRDFEVIREIGRGALSRVLLAKQTSLSGREVVLKFAPKHLLEAEKLAQLQHPNIVPVFSVYEDRDFHVFCMPYLGDATLLDSKTKLGQQSGAVNSVATTVSLEQHALNVLESLTQAIEHAHGRGILHNDIKPANVLWVDDQPMLLDFNLAAVSSDRNEPQIGGTLPYMAPESLEGFESGRRTVDERSDLFSLGALVFELVTGEPPFGSHKTIEANKAARQSPAPPMNAGRQLSPGFEAIVRKCLSLRPELRYQSASELLTDVQLHRTNHPLRHAENTSKVERVQKWTRRHPRLTSPSTLVAISGLILTACLLAWFARERHFANLEAEKTYTDFVAATDRLIPLLSSIGRSDVDIDAAIEAAEDTLAIYVPADAKTPQEATSSPSNASPGKGQATWQSNTAFQRLPHDLQTALDQRIARLAFLTAASHAYLSPKDRKHLTSARQWNAVASLGEASVERATDLQLAFINELASELNQENEVFAIDAITQAKSGVTGSAIDLQLTGWLARVRGSSPEAIEYLRKACEAQPDDYSMWFQLAQAYMDQQQNSKAANCFTTCLALKPETPYAQYYRGLARLANGELTAAIGDFSDLLPRAEAGSSGRQNILLNRAIAYNESGNFKASLNDLNEAIRGGLTGSRPLLIRSRVKRSLGDVRGANEDLNLAIATPPRDDRGWVAIGMTKISNQPAEALTDFQKALELNPRSHSARRSMAHVLSERLGRTNEAIDVLTAVISDYPIDAGAVSGRGVLLARAGRFEEAIADAKRVVELNAGPRDMFRVACIYSIASREKPEFQKAAVSLLGSSFKRDPSLVKLATKDPDLKDIHDLEAFDKICAAARQFAAIPAAEAAVEHTDF